MNCQPKKSLWKKMFYIINMDINCIEMKGKLKKRLGQTNIYPLWIPISIIYMKILCWKHHHIISSSY